VGPNCSGIINTHHNVVQSIGVVGDLRKGNIGLIAQAGVYAAGILWGMRHIMDFAVVATIGNKADINETDILEYLGEDDNVKVVCMYLEDVKSGRRFVDVARRITARKPVIVLKSGRTEAGKKAVASHTASLAGNDQIYDAAFRQAGIIRATDNDHMFGLARAFFQATPSLRERRHGYLLHRLFGSGGSRRPFLEHDEAGRTGHGNQSVLERNPAPIRGMQQPGRLHL
jgi:acyl-CoA synthetase (NDP forming)